MPLLWDFIILSEGLFVRRFKAREISYPIVSIVLTKIWKKSKLLISIPTVCFWKSKCPKCSRALISAWIWSIENCRLTMIYSSRWSGNDMPSGQVSTKSKTTTRRRSWEQRNQPISFFKIYPISAKLYRQQIVGVRCMKFVKIFMYNIILSNLI